jgi:prevent-host-death family protein
MKVNTKEARRTLSTLLSRVEAGEEVTITRNGQDVAKLVPVDSTSKVLPDLRAFRASLRSTGEPASQTVKDMREDYRY